MRTPTKVRGAIPARMMRLLLLPAMLVWATAAGAAEDGRAELGPPLVLKKPTLGWAVFRDEGRLIVMAHDKTQEVFDAATGKSLRHVPTDVEENGLPFPMTSARELGPDLFVSACMEKTPAGVPSWREMARSLKTGKVVYRTRWPDWAFDFRRTLSPDGRHLAVTYLVEGAWERRGLDDVETPPPPRIRGELRVYELEGFKLKFTEKFPIDRFGEVDPYEGSERRHIPMFLGNDKLAVSLGSELRYFDPPDWSKTSSTLSKHPMLEAIVSSDL